MARVFLSLLAFFAIWASSPFALAASPEGEPPAPAVPEPGKPVAEQEQTWNLHIQNTDIVQWHPRYPAKYSGPQSDSPRSEVRETVSVDVTGGLRAWRGGEIYVDGLMWQGWGLGKTLGYGAHPNGESFRVGTNLPKGTVSRAFLRQTFGLGGEQEQVEDDLFQLAGKRDIARVTLTVGKISVKDIFDANTYSSDPRTQFMNWVLLANGAWDFAADGLGYTTGFAVELNQPKWALRYGMFQIPKHLNGMGADPHYLEAWQMVAEAERRWVLGSHPGAVRLLGFLTRGHMGRFRDALDSPLRPADTLPVRNGFQLKYGGGLNMEQELFSGIGTFLRASWSDGHTDSWMFTDVDRHLSGGISIKGRFWKRPEDTLGIGAALNGLSRIHSEYFTAGGTGILVGDGTQSYKTERLLETYYDIHIAKWLHAAVDYQLVVNPAYNRDRGPISVFGARVRWSF